MSDFRDAAMFCNADWSVHADGLEHRGTGYFIERAVLGARRAEHLWDWPLQMAEKRWCRPSLFREAFLAALDRFGIARDAELTRSFALGYGIRASDAPPAPGFLPLAAFVTMREPARPALPCASGPALAVAGV